MHHPVSDARILRLLPYFVHVRRIVFPAGKEEEEVDSPPVEFFHNVDDKIDLLVPDHSPDVSENDAVRAGAVRTPQILGHSLGNPLEERDIDGVVEDDGLTLAEEKSGKKAIICRR
jgi:hypothetical protein